MKAGVWIELDLDIAEVRSNAAPPFAIELTKRLAEDPLKMEICRCHDPNPASQPILWACPGLVNPRSRRWLKALVIAGKSGVDGHARADHAATTLR